jgi:hypothetical protein
MKAAIFIVFQMVVTTLALMSGRGVITGTGDADDTDLRNRDMFRDTGLGEGGRGAFEHTGGENESRHLHNRGDRDFVLRSFEPFARRR